MKKMFPLLLACLFAITGCKPEASAPKTGDPAIQTYDGRGIVRRIAPDRSEVTIKHEAIPGYMMAMTMDFTVKNTNELRNIAPGDQINFKLRVTETNSWIESIRFDSHVVEKTSNGVFTFHKPTAELKPGDPMPDFTLTAEDGRPVHCSDFRGRVLAFTFFFTRCPLPDFCPRMDLNFSAARALLRAAPDAPTNWQFLSISFDPENDLPATLVNYAEFYRHNDADRWLFSVADTNTLARLAPQLDLMIVREDNTISHNLRTVVLDPQGRIARQFDGNRWTPKELADAMLAAARSATNSTSR